ncbi:hypothetical protein V2J09_001787 [Rumex salicifolius]
MEESSDFVAILGSDISIKILLCLDDPSDLRSASAVSTSWRRCDVLIDFESQISDFHGSEREDGLAVEHAKYSSLARSLTTSKLTSLVYDAISASSTDHWFEGMENTLIPGDEVHGRSSYWSSIGESDPQVPESLVYKLVSDFCVITEIHVQAHKGYNEEEFGCPIYSAKAVKFRLGRRDFNSFDTDKFVWTYTSPEFPMIQREGIQKFLLPEPVLCIGGIMQIELLGRIIMHPLDDIVSYVEAMGRNLSPEFDVEFIDKSGRVILKHNPDA